MKKYQYLLFLFLVLVVFVICWRLFPDKNGISLPVNIETEKSQVIISKDHSDFQFPWEEKDVLSYEGPQHISEVVYGEVFSDPEWTHSGEVSRYYDKKADQWIAKIKGYAHTYTFSDFGIVLGTNEAYDDEFLEKTPINLVRRYKDDLYDVVYKGTFYIQRFEKKLNENFDLSLLKKHHSITGCSFASYIHSSDVGNLLNIPKTHDIYSLDFGQETEYCEPNTNNVIYFVYNPKRPSSYYKLSWEDGCAPSCGLPKYFEILEK